MALVAILVVFVLILMAWLPICSRYCKKKEPERKYLL